MATLDIFPLAWGLVATFVVAARQAASWADERVEEGETKAMQ
jgi:hypothetical protein